MRFEDQARVLLDEKVPVFSFIYGIPPREILEECRAKRIVTIGTATTPEESCSTSGRRRGCHRRFRLRSRGTSRFIPPRRGGFTYRHLFARPSDCRHRSNVPVIAAGGIADARGVVAALALGAEAVQMGTVFLACEESGASPLHRQALRGKKCRTHRADKGLHRKTRAGNPQPLAGGVEPKRNGDPALSAATKTRQKPRDRGRGGGPIGSPAPMGRAKCQSFYLHRRIGFLDLIGRGGF